MTSGGWQALYASPWQSVWGLVVLPAGFLLWWLVAGRPRGASAEPRAAALVRVWGPLFALESILDATVPALGGSMLPFVLLGDFRIFLLLEAVSRPGRPLGAQLATAAAWTLLVPAVAAAGYVSWVEMRAAEPAAVLAVLANASSSQVLWLLYECAFATLAVVLAVVVLPARRPPAMPYLRAVLALVLAYYLLWAVADVLILAGVDLGWALRIVPNQLYYGVSVPAAWLLFFREPSPASAASSTPVQAAR